MLIRYRKTKKTKKVPPWLHFAMSGTSSLIATAIVQPMDLLKTRMQLLGVDGKRAGLLQTTSNILKNEGFTGFYRGLTAALFKQAVYTCGRMGCYSQILEMYKKDHGSPKFYDKVAIGMLAGGVGAFISTPAEVALIRTTADGRLPISQKRNYRNVFSTIGRITCEEGFSTLWRGATTTVTRAVVVNGVQLGTYVEAREYLQEHLTDGVKLYFASSLIAGFVATIALLPIDIVKTRVQNAFDRQSQFKILMDIIRNEGVLTLWSGLIPSYCKAAPSTILVYLLMDQLNTIYNNTTTSK